MTKTPPPAFSTSLLYTLYSPRNSHLVFTCFNGQNCWKQNSPPTIATVRCKPDYSLFFWTCFLISMNFPHTALLPTILPGNLSSTHLPNHLITISKSFLRHHLNHLPNISPRTQNQPAPTCSFPNCVMCICLSHFPLKIQVPLLQSLMLSTIYRWIWLCKLLLWFSWWLFIQWAHILHLKNFHHFFLQLEKEKLKKTQYPVHLTFKEQVLQRHINCIFHQNLDF